MTRAAPRPRTVAAGWSPGRVRLLLAVLVVLQLVRTVPRGSTPFARSYFTVDYRAGFVRRGLAGEVLHLVAGSGPVAVAAAAVVVALVPTVAVLVLVAALVRRGGTPAVATAVLLVASPFVLDQLWLHRRPDQLGLALLVATGFAARRGGTARLACCGAGWVVVALVHEGAVLYFGTSAVLLVAVAARGERARLRGVALVGLPALAGLVVATVAGAATPGQVAVLLATTRPADRQDSVLFYLGDTVGDSVDRVVGFDHGAQLAMLVVGAVLVTVQWWWLRRTTGGEALGRAWALLPRRWAVLVLGLPAAAVVLTFASGTDWVRWVCSVGSAWLVCCAFGVLDAPRVPGRPRLARGLVVVALYLAALSPLREQLTVREALTAWVPAL